MSNSPKVPNLVCDPRENLQKLASTSTGKNYRELLGGHCAIKACVAYYFLFYASHMKIYAAWTSLMVYDTLKWKQITHVQKCILTFESLFIADNILKAAIVTVSS